MVNYLDYLHLLDVVCALLTLVVVHEDYFVDFVRHGFHEARLFYLEVVQDERRLAADDTEANWLYVCAELRFQISVDERRANGIRIWIFMTED